MKLIFLALLSALILCGCKTTTPQGQRVPDKAGTAKVVAVAEGVSRIALVQALKRFPSQADQIALYARAVGGIFCDMQRTKKFSPESLVAALDALANTPLSEEWIGDPAVREYVTDARDVLVTAYRIFYADRFSAELSPDEWPAAVAEIFCVSIDAGLKDSGREGVK